MFMFSIKPSEICTVTPTICLVAQVNIYCACVKYVRQYERIVLSSSMACHAESYCVCVTYVRQYDKLVLSPATHSTVCFHSGCMIKIWHITKINNFVYLLNNYPPFLPKQSHIFNKILPKSCPQRVMYKTVICLHDNVGEQPSFFAV